MLDKVQVYAALFKEAQELLYGSSLPSLEKAAASSKPILKVLGRSFSKPIKPGKTLTVAEKQMRGVHVAEELGKKVAKSKEMGTLAKGLTAGAGIGILGTGAALSSGTAQRSAEAKSRGRLEGAALGAAAALAAPHLSRLAGSQGFVPEGFNYQQGAYV